MDAVGDVVVRGIIPALVAAVLSMGSVVFVGLFHIPAALALAVCLLLAGVVAPWLAQKAARETELQSSQARTDMSVLSHELVSNSAELAVAGSLNTSFEALAGIEQRLRLRKLRCARALDHRAVGTRERRQRLARPALPYMQVVQAQNRAQFRRPSALRPGELHRGDEVALRAGLVGDGQRELQHAARAIEQRHEEPFLRTLLGVERSGRMLLKYKTAQFVVTGPVMAVCRRCSEINEVTVGAFPEPTPTTGRAA